MPAPARPTRTFHAVDVPLEQGWTLRVGLEIDADGAPVELVIAHGAEVDGAWAEASVSIATPASAIPALIETIRDLFLAYGGADVCSHPASARVNLHRLRHTAGPDGVLAGDCSLCGERSLPLEPLVALSHVGRADSVTVTMPSSPRVSRTPR